MHSEPHSQDVGPTAPSLPLPVLLPGVPQDSLPRVRHPKWYQVPAVVVRRGQNTALAPPDPSTNPGTQGTLPVSAAEAGRGRSTRKQCHKDHGNDKCAANSGPLFQTRGCGWVVLPTASHCWAKCGLESRGTQPSKAARASGRDTDRCGASGMGGRVTLSQGATPRPTQMSQWTGAAGRSPWPWPDALSSRFFHQMYHKWEHRVAWGRDLLSAFEEQRTPTPRRAVPGDD